MIPQNEHAHVVGNKWLPLLNCDPRLRFDTPFAVEEIHILFDNLTERLPVHDRNLHLEVIALISYEYIKLFTSMKYFQKTPHFVEKPKQDNVNYSGFVLKH